MNEFNFENCFLCSEPGKPDKSICKKLAEKNIDKPTAVQKTVIPAVYEGSSCLFESETGTGKTLAYLLPLVQRLYIEQNYSEKAKQKRKLNIIIAVPTKELAVQIKNELSFLLPETEKVPVCFGGSPIKRQIDALKEKPFALVGSAERISELIRLKKIKTAEVMALVFDEADRLLSRETADNSLKLLQFLPNTIQFIACSATMTESVQQKLISALQKSATQPACERRIQSFILPKENVLAGKITHWAFYAEERDKADMLRRFLAAEKPAKALVFCPSAETAEKTAAYLNFKKIKCFALHAKSDKVKRKQALDTFKNGSCTVLITSDLAGRGLDIPDISHVIQMGVASNSDFFIHRAGRTARSDKTGINAVIGNERDLRMLAQFEKELKITVYPKDLRDGKVISPDERQAEP